MTGLAPRRIWNDRHITDARLEAFSDAAPERLVVQTSPQDSRHTRRIALAREYVTELLVGG
jgi:hypothetical protein